MRISDWSSDVCSSDLFIFGIADTKADADRARRQRIVHAHRGQHMRSRDLSRRASSARTDGDAVEIERHDERSSIEARCGKEARIGKTWRLGGEDGQASERRFANGWCKAHTRGSEARL